MASTLSKYIGATQQHVEELRQSLTEDDLTALREDIVLLGRNDWIAWQSLNRHQIAEFLLATPTARNRRKSWQDQSLRLRLTYGAIRYAQESVVALSMLHQSNWLSCSSVVGYRDMTVAAADVFYEMAHHMRAIEMWPFHEVDSPFQ